MEQVSRLLVTEGSDGSSEVELWWQIIAMVCNTLAYIAIISLGATTDQFMPYKQAEIVEIWDTQIVPAGWAFSIWGAIFTLLGVFTIYQVLPSEWVVNRSDDMIYYQMNLIFAISMALTAAWLPFFQTNTLWGFIVGWVLLCTVTILDTALMVISDRNNVWWLEVFVVRLPISLLTGWVTSATVLNTVIMLKSWGMADPPTAEKPLNPIAWTWASDLMFITEEEWTIVAVWIAEIYYEIVSWTERNPVFGGVFSWAVAGMLYENVTKKEYNENLIINLSIIEGIHTISMIILTGYLIFEEFQPWYMPLSFWNNGIVSLTDWSQMFDDVSYASTAIGKYFTDTYGSRAESA